MANQWVIENSSPLEEKEVGVEKWRGRAWRTDLFICCCGSMRLSCVPGRACRILDPKVTKVQRILSNAGFTVVLFFFTANNS